ncbi:tetratricopeptide repeat-containing protein [Pelagimonas phthalicica]|nr:tetratricopeptide repeat-containing protein [Pelagimonas phthalicica]
MPGERLNAGQVELSMTKKCFVVMGFNQKTDPITARVLDLDKTYKGIIKPAAEAAGFECVRADEIQHSGVIDVPMYQFLQDADLVIADLSTLNPNAFFELGVRYALKRRKTIVIAENGFANPFDTNHIVVRRYQHDGLVLDFEVVESFRAELTELIKAVDEADQDDSPVFQFLGNVEDVDFNKDSVSEAVDEAAYFPLIEQAKSLRSQGKFAEMSAVLEAIRISQGEDVDPYILQQLALAHYKSEHPNKRAALEKAKDVLADLKPEQSLDAETIGLWGAVHKRLAGLDSLDENERTNALDVAIDALYRGFYLLNDYYNGINAAFLLDLRASRFNVDAHEAVADRVQARRLRVRVKEITDKLLSEQVAGESELNRVQNRYWIEATKVEAMFGLGEEAEASALLGRLRSYDGIESWMIDTTVNQLEKLGELL